MTLTKEVISTTIVVVLFFMITQLINFFVKKFTLLKAMDLNRKKIIQNLGYFLFFSILCISIAIIWGVELEQFSVFISSVLAVLGVGFFAQWSILSNLTASVILFFYHPIRIGQRVRILDKDFEWIGVVTDITGFHLFLKTDRNENITLPNSLVIQKGIEILPTKDEH